MCLVLTLKQPGTDTAPTEQPVVSKKLPAHPSPPHRRMKAWQARASRQHPGMDPSPMAISGTIWQREALHSAAHQFRLGLEGASPSGVLPQAKPGS